MCFLDITADLGNSRRNTGLQDTAKEVGKVFLPHSTWHAHPEQTLKGS